MRGTGVALITPFHNDLSIDFGGLTKMIKYVEDGDIDFIVALGTTAETSTLTQREKIAVLDHIFSHASLPIIIGHGGNDTLALVDDLQTISGYPAAALLSVTPYYNKPSQEGLIKHYEMLADQSSKPIILYNVPSRTGCNLECQTTLLLAKHENIIGIKEATADLSQVDELVKNTGSDFLIWSGDDSLTFKSLGLGIDGAISVVANYCPSLFSKMIRSYLNGEEGTAKGLNDELLLLYELVSQEGNPTSVKAGLAARGIINPTVRLPLVQGSSQLINRFKSL